MHFQVEKLTTVNNTEWNATSLCRQILKSGFITGLRSLTA